MAHHSAGNNRSACFYAPDDYLRYLETLHEVSRKYGCTVHAYVLMTNHVHLLLTPLKATSAALLMKHLGQRYVQYVNRTYRRSGTLWEGRFRSCLTQSEDYVLACYRYIGLNPVRAAMVEQPADYRWSSYTANADGKPDQLVTPHTEYLRLGRTADDRRCAFRALFNAHLEPLRVDQIRHATNGNYALGSSRFKAEIERALKRRATPRHSGRSARQEK